MRFSARKLDKKDFFGKSGKNFSRRSFRGTYIFTIDPYLVISKSKEDGSWVKVHQTEVIMKVKDHFRTYHQIPAKISSRLIYTSFSKVGGISG